MVSARYSNQQSAGICILQEAFRLVCGGAVAEFNRVERFGLYIVARVLARTSKKKITEFDALIGIKA